MILIKSLDYTMDHGISKLFPALELCLLSFKKKLKENH